MKFKVFAGALGLLVLTGLAKVSRAGGIAVPQDLQGRSIATVDFAGALPCVLDAATATGAISCSSATASFGGTSFDTTGRGEVLGVIFSSITALNYVVLRDTATSNIASATMTVVSPLAITQQAGSLGQFGYVKFPVPIQYKTGLSANMGQTLTSTGMVTILYRPFKQIE